MIGLLIALGLLFGSPVIILIVEICLPREIRERMAKETEEENRRFWELHPKGGPHHTSADIPWF